MTFQATTRPLTNDIFGHLVDPTLLNKLFSRFNDCVFSVKDRDGRYVVISDVCVERCGLRSKNDAIGKTAHELFPDYMAKRYEEQDKYIFETGQAVYDNLDLTLFKNQKRGWCITHKIPLIDGWNHVVGLVCISRDIPESTGEHYVDERLSQTIDYIKANYNKSCRVEMLASMAGLSVHQFERRIKSFYQLTPSQFVTKTRIDRACELLLNIDLTIAEIALKTGYCDQSALTRYFKQVTGMNPGEYRRNFVARQRAMA